MKKFIFAALMMVMCFNIPSFGQAASPRGTYGTLATKTPVAMKCYNNAGVTKVAGYDTLSNTDTGYLYLTVPTNYNLTFDLLTITRSGTVASTNNILQGSMDGYSNSATWYDITGFTSGCATCVGASTTLVPGASKHYVWKLPSTGGYDWQYYRIRTIQTGTCTATYTGTLTYDY